MRGSYVGSEEIWRGGGIRSETFWPAFLLMSSVDMGFFRNGRPFFARECSTGSAAALGYGSGSRALDCGILPVGLTPERRSVGVTKEVDGLPDDVFGLVGSVDGCGLARC